MTVINATQTTDAAAYIQEHGWTRHEMEDEHGAVCLTGALKACSPQPGDWLLAREVFRRWDLAEEWNDADERTQTEVVAALAESITLKKGLTGAKPERFCRWVLDLLGYCEGDSIDDLFPGTNVMQRTLDQLTLVYGVGE